MVHNLKIRKPYFDAIINGTKTFEVRKNDRGFKVGDIVDLEEIDDDGYTLRYIVVEITYILDDPQYCLPGYVIFAFKLRLDKGVATT